jgi:hypothetical protein
LACWEWLNIQPPCACLGSQGHAEEFLRYGIKKKVIVNDKQNIFGFDGRERGHDALTPGGVLAVMKGTNG